MAAPKLGTKFTCYKCSCKFYDLRKPDPICPDCGADQRQSPALKSTEGRKPRGLQVVPKAPPPAAIEPAEPMVVEEADISEEELESLDGGDDEEIQADDEEI